MDVSSEHEGSPGRCAVAAPDPPGWIRRRFTLRVRLSLMMTALLALLTIVLGLFMIDRARHDIRIEVRSTMNLIGHYLDAEVDLLRDRRGIGYSPGARLFHLGHLQGVRHLEISYYDQNGRLVEKSLPRGDPGAGVPAWFAWLVEASSSPVADVRHKVDLDGMSIGELVLHPDPRYVTGEIWSVSRDLLGMLVLFFTLVDVLIWWVVSRGMRPLDRIIAALGEIERENLGVRLPMFALPEMSRVSSGFNHMAERLQGSLAENRQLTRRLIDIQERERRHLARELHDEIGQCVTAIHADAVTIRGYGETLPSPQAAALRDSAEAIVEVAGHIKGLVRGLLQRLRPATLDSLGLEPALRELVAGFRGRNPETDCRLRVDAALDAVDEEIGISVYRVVQEALTNAVLHAAAHRVEIAVGRETDAGGEILCLRIEDDGCGFDPRAASSGFGLRGIRERVRALDGTCGIDSRPGHGTRVVVSLPLSEPRP